MGKTSKIIYFIISILFFTIINRYFTNLLINSRFYFQKNSVFDIVYVQNTGAAFSLLENLQILLIIIGITAILLIFTYFIKNADKFSVFAGFWAALLVSGIFCNLFERLSFGYVRDFFSLSFIDFPVFNII